MIGGILAAGKGQRLRAYCDLPKALVPIAHKSLLDRSLELLLECTPDRIICIVNSATAARVGERIGDTDSVPVELLVRNTRSAFFSFIELASHAGNGCFLFVTVDAIMSPGVLRGLVEDDSFAKADLLVGVTKTVEDDSPVYAKLDGHHNVLAFGDALGSCDFVTAGVYAGRSSILDKCLAARAQGIRTLRSFLSWLVVNGSSVYAHDLGDVLDIDTKADVQQAEERLRCRYADK